MLVRRGTNPRRPGGRSNRTSRTAIRELVAALLPVRRTNFEQRTNVDFACCTNGAPCSRTARTRIAQCSITQRSQQRRRPRRPASHRLCASPRRLGTRSAAPYISPRSACTPAAPPPKQPYRALVSTAVPVCHTFLAFLYTRCIVRYILSRGNLCIDITIPFAPAGAATVTLAAAGGTASLAVLLEAAFVAAACARPGCWPRAICSC